MDMKMARRAKLKLTAPSRGGGVFEFVVTSSRSPLRFVLSVTFAVLFGSSLPRFLGYSNSVSELGLGIALTLWFVVSELRRVVEESVLIAPGLGVVIASRAAFGWGNRSKFIAAHSIKEIVLNEGIQFASVIFYLALILKEEHAAPPSVEVLFPALSPPLHILKEVYASVLERGFS